MPKPSAGLWFNSMPEIPTGLYVHFPWCVRKCPYCDFNSHEQDGSIPEADYTRVLISELRQEAAASQPLHSIFFGGGTPSLISPGNIAMLIEEAETLFSFSHGMEITLEANPGTLDDSRIRDFRQAGVNRLSLGIQSFNDLYLRQLGRIHSSGDAARAIANAREAGITNLNLDLMHGLPNQTWADAEQDLETAISFQPEHISWYQLTIEPNTVFYRYPPALPDEDTLFLIQERGMQLLEDNGYQRYEVSAFSRSGSQCRHNLNYWQFGDYIGVGAGAHGKYTTDQGVFRTSRTRMPKSYLRDPGKKVTQVAREELPLEFMMNALRLSDGVDLSSYETRTGLPVETIQPFLHQAFDRGFLTARDEIRLTTFGMRFVDEVLLLLTP